MNPTRFDRDPDSSPSHRSPADLPEGLRVYAVGDIHGHAELFDRMARKIAADLAEQAPARALAVFLGDYVDRGPDSAGVIERLIEGRFPTPLIPLRGNHEDMMMQALAHPAAMEPWCRNGALETIASYGVEVEAELRGRGLFGLRRQLIAVLPRRHCAFLSETRLFLEVGDYFFVHAGARPGVPLDRQSEEDLLWIRDEFHRSGYDFGKVIVHGHTPHPRPENEARRINVDTGAFRWGTLTCLVLEGTTRRFISVRSDRER